MPRIGSSMRKSGVARGDLVNVRNATLFNMLEGAKTLGNQRAVSRQLDTESLVCVILSRTDSGDLPTMNCTKGKGVS